MHVVTDPEQVAAQREVLMKYLNDLSLDGAAILGLSRRAEVVRVESGEAVLTQGQRVPYVYFLLQGRVEVRLNIEGTERPFWEREAICLLGEIAYFNQTPATATVVVAGDQPAVFCRLHYDRFGTILDTHPDVKRVLERIGDLRLISQNNGFVSYLAFMEFIGWRRDRFALNRALFAHLETTVVTLLLPRLGLDDRILEVGDGPGVLCELLHELQPTTLDQLYLLANQLEDAIADPHVPHPSDFSRARWVPEKFQVVLALQVFNMVAPAAVDQQFRAAHDLLLPGGMLMVVKMRLFNISYDGAQFDPHRFYETLEGLVDRHWPQARQGRPLIQMSFSDADLDPLMTWNEAVCAAVAAGEIALPDGLDGEGRVLLENLLGQCRVQVFDPDDLHYRWLMWKAETHGFKPWRAQHHSDIGYFYQIYEKA